MYEHIARGIIVSYPIIPVISPQLIWGYALGGFLDFTVPRCRS